MSDKDEIIEYKLEQTKQDSIDLRKNIEEIKEIIHRIDAKLMSIPVEFKCPVHTIKLENCEKKLDIMEQKVDAINTKVISWSAVIGVILFIVSNVGIPYINKKIDASPHSHPESTEKTMLYDRYPNSSPMPFIYSNSVTMK